MKKLRTHLEWVAFLAGLIIMGSIDPNIKETSLCFFEFIGISYCPGDGLGHSIAWFFRGEFSKSFNANLFGPIAVVVLSARIIMIWKEKLTPLILEEGQTDDTSI